MNNNLSGGFNFENWNCQVVEIGNFRLILLFGTSYQFVKLRSLEKYKVVNLRPPTSYTVGLVHSNVRWSGYVRFIHT